MLKKLILSAIALASVSFTQAQQVSLLWSTDSGMGSASNSLASGSEGQIFKLSLVPTFSGGISLIPKITVHNKELKETNQQSISIADKETKSSGILTTKDHLYFFTNMYDKKLKSTGFYCQALDINSFENKGENTNLISLAADKEAQQPIFKYQLSADSTKLLLTGATNDRSGTGKYYLGVYDEAMKKLWDKTIDLPNKGKDMVVLSESITNDGRVVLLVKHFDKGTQDEHITQGGKKLPAYSTKLLWFDKGEAAPKELPLNTGDRFIHSIALAKEEKNELTLFGLYQQKPEGNINGYVIFKVSATNAEITSTGEFAATLLQSMEKDEQGSNNKKDGGLSPYFKFVKMETRENGDRDFLLEFTKGRLTPTGFTVGPDPRANSRPSALIFVHGNIIDINIKANGEKLITRIPKLQDVADLDHVSSFNTLVYKDKLLFFYNDASDNLKQDIAAKPKKTNFGIGGRKLLGSVDANLAMAIIDAQGNVSRKIIIDRKQTPLIPAVNASIKMSTHQLAFYAINGRKELIGLLEVK